MADATLKMLLDEVRGKTLRRLEGLTEAEARWAPSGLQNSALWHAGHSYMVVEFLSMSALGLKPVLPDGWWDLFSWESRPGGVPADRWPSLETVVAELRAQRERLGSLIDGLDEEQLAAPNRRKPDQTVRYAILHGLHDEACHSGEIWLLRKLAGSRPD